MAESNAKAMKRAGIDRSYIELATVRIAEHDLDGAIQLCVQAIEILSEHRKAQLLRLTVLEWHAKLGCSTGQVCSLPIFRARMRLIRGSKTVRLSDKLQTTLADPQAIMDSLIEDERNERTGGLRPARISSGRVVGKSNAADY